MLKMSDDVFMKAIEMIENLSSSERIAFFNQNTADIFLLWRFYYFRDDFVAVLADFHYDWIEWLFTKKNIIIEAFRWSIKTSLIIAYQTYRIVYWFTKYLVRQSYDNTASTSNTTNILDKLLYPTLEADYGKQVLLIWWDRESLQQKSVGNFDTINGVKVRALSLQQKLRWALSKLKRPDTIVFDDIDTTDSVRSIKTIDKNLDKIKNETLGALSKTGNNQIILLWNTISEQGILPAFKSEYKNSKWRLIYKQELIRDDKIQRDWISEEVVEKIRADEWTIAFGQNYLLIPKQAYTNWIIKEERLRYYEYINLEDFDTLYMHCDTTHTGKTTSDYFCGLIIGENKRDHNFYLIDFILEKLDVETQARKTIVLYSKYASKIKKLTYDEKANQWFGYWIKKLAKEEYNISLPIEELNYPHDKVTHFEPHIPHFIANRIYLPSRHKQIDEAEIQLLAFPNGEENKINDDFVDGISWAMDNYIKKKKKLFIQEIK